MDKLFVVFSFAPGKKMNLNIRLRFKNFFPLLIFQVYMHLLLVSRIYTKQLSFKYKNGVFVECICKIFELHFPYKYKVNECQQNRKNNSILDFKHCHKKSSVGTKKRNMFFLISSLQYYQRILNFDALKTLCIILIR